MNFAGPNKPIVYRGGLVRFAIPESWIEEYEKAGGGTFYDPTDSSTLRLNLLSFSCDHDVSISYPRDLFLSRAPEYNGSVEELSGGRFLLKYVISTEENGEMLSIFYWETAKMVSARDFNTAVFSFTVETVRSETTEIRQIIGVLESEIKQVQFGIYTNCSE